MEELRRIVDKNNSNYIAELKERWHDFCQKVLFYGDKDPNAYLKKRPLSCPVLLVSESNCLLAIGDEPIHTLLRCEAVDGVLYLMANYYAIHLTYPKCVATLLSVIQTEVLLDKIHEGDLTPSYKKAIADWKAFNNPRQ
ncbi:hypothetical protein KUCAC02_001961 [Xyrichtys novacula]|uniref:Uncharacterized protein n=1 Tax=Xyrichtys novacula TaxID=13765 RepID=A0AAV1EQ01_XYRNO|nr:hypothetical protein KUCAC02_001961 [Xyrichtys novacula]